MPPKSALLLINRKSRNGAAELDDALHVLENSGMHLSIEFPGHASEIAQRIEAHAQRTDCVILGGGDGTMNAAAGALVKHQLPFGVFPMGTANDLARTLGIPATLTEAAEIIIAGKTRPIDIGCGNGIYFFNVANIGLGVQVKHELTAETKKRWGILSYAKGVFSAFRKSHPFHARINCDGQRVNVRSIQIAVGNGRYYGGGMAVAEDAQIDDQLFALYSIEPVSLWTLARHMPALRAGQFGAIEPALLLYGRRITIETSRPMPVSMDGEVRTRTPVRFTLAPNAVQVFAPEAAPGLKENENVTQERETSCL